MKGPRLLFAVFLAPLTFFGAVADDASEIARAATARRDAPTTLSSTRKSVPQSHKSAAVSRTTTQSVTQRERPTDQSTRGNATTAVIDDDARTATPIRGVSARTTATVQPRATQKSVQKSRATTTGRSATTPTRTYASARTATTPNTSRTRATATPSRAATLSRNADTLRSQIMSRDFSKCRTVFYDCMDEFCANNDSLLKRCACSSRATEFDATKKRLEKIDEKLLDFSQRLLTVNMDAEDVDAMNTATEGELAFNQEDKSQSKKLLDEIAKKLNTSFDDSNFDQSLNAISLSLNTDAAFDSVDSMMGATTTTKSGTELYNAALPVCREMAMEVCTPDELAIAQSGYQMTIEQDCNTVAKSYQNLTDQARTKVFESGALLDMSRLDIHQQRNSDDILTCKKKMLAMLTDTTVCGQDLGQCLDISGQYIDPTTGAAFLTENLANLSTLISRPDTNQTWTTAPGNDRFVSYLNSKKKFLEPAMENCQDIADSVWDAFIEDAMSQIKLAQESKLEDMRRSCTTLLSECLDDANESISEFDSRALSIFGVSADMTVNAMCANVRQSCTALLDATGGGIDWSTGISDITTNITYEKLLTTCREVGRQCIIRTCTSITGNFGLCENIDTSINRKSIINQTACWPDVINCVASAGTSALDAIMTQQGRNATSNDGYIYQKLYDNVTYIHDLCTNCGTGNNPDCNTCRFAEQIWGNCEKAPTTQLTGEETNKIYVNNEFNPDNETLLSWFARNTGTADKNDSCRDTTCPAGQLPMPNGICASASEFTSDGTYCPDGNNRIYVTDTHTNCCENGFDDAGHCCGDGTELYDNIGKGYRYSTSPTNKQKICVPDTGDTDKPSPFAEYSYTKDGIDVYGYLLCDGTIDKTSDDANITDNYPSGQNVICDTSSGGKGWIHARLRDGGYPAPTTSYTYYYNTDGKPCVRQENLTDWKLCGKKDKNANTTDCPLQGKYSNTHNNKTYYMFKSYTDPCNTQTEPNE
ncbi:MAG: hypothetical protein J6K82_03945 [Alphaproteobacteria bacterium]|nr:hypothetical protein [Alphaproteobacteria bacterium]